MIDTMDEMKEMFKDDPEIMNEIEQVKSCNRFPTWTWLNLNCWQLIVDMALEDTLAMLSDADETQQSIGMK